jgi:hypothetical protein
MGKRRKYMNGLRTMTELFSTHSPIEERAARLDEKVKAQIRRAYGMDNRFTDMD